MDRAKILKIFLLASLAIFAILIIDLNAPLKRVKCYHFSYNGWWICALKVGKHSANTAILRGKGVKRSEIFPRESNLSILLRSCLCTHFTFSRYDVISFVIFYVSRVIICLIYSYLSIFYFSLNASYLNTVTNKHNSFASRFCPSQPTRGHQILKGGVT